METRFGILPMVLCMLSGIALYILIQQVGIIQPLQGLYGGGNYTFEWEQPAKKK